MINYVLIVTDNKSAQKKFLPLRALWPREISKLNTFFFFFAFKCKTAIVEIPLSDVDWKLEEAKETWQTRQVFKRSNFKMDDGGSQIAVIFRFHWIHLKEKQ